MLGVQRLELGVLEVDLPYGAHSPGGHPPAECRLDRARGGVLRSRRLRLGLLLLLLLNRPLLRLHDLLHEIRRSLLLLHFFHARALSRLTGLAEAHRSPTESCTRLSQQLLASSAGGQHSQRAFP